MQIIYEHHPVTPERKAELRAAGYKIIDAQFDPNPASRSVETAEDRRAYFEAKFPDMKLDSEVAEQESLPADTVKAPKRGRKPKE